MKQQESTNLLQLQMYEAAKATERNIYIEKHISPIAM